MKTLLEKVKAVEEKAQQILAEAERGGQKKLADLVAGERDMLQQARLTAEHEGAAIIKEKLQTARKEIDAVRQAGVNAAERISRAAEEHQARAVDKMRQLFEAEYNL